MIARALVLLLAALVATGAQAQGFAGLGTQADGYAIPQRGTTFDFPRDHLAHPAYRIEWWYLTATLRGEDGADYGVQWTLFRSAMTPPAPDGAPGVQLWMGHAGLTTREAHYYAERLGRDSIGVAGVSADPFEAFIDDWRMASVAAPGADRLSHLALTARGNDFSYDLSLIARGPLVPQGETGYSVKSPAGQASYYYSQPFYEVSGTLTTPNGEVTVTGQGWLDREWSSQPLAEDQTGWDWFSLSFEDGARMMGFGLRASDGGHITSATWIDPDGTPTPFGDGALRLTPLATERVNGREVPVRWRLSLPARGLEIETRPLNPQSWMGTSFPYWEGPITFEGSHQGRGYLEMTGYERP